MHLCSLNGNIIWRHDCAKQSGKMMVMLSACFHKGSKTNCKYVELMKLSDWRFWYLVTKQSFVLFSFISKAKGRKLKISFRVNLHFHSVPCILYLMCLWSPPFFSKLQWHTGKAVKHVLKGIRLYTRNYLLYANWFNHVIKLYWLM